MTPGEDQADTGTASPPTQRDRLLKAPRDQATADRLTPVLIEPALPAPCRPEVIVWDRVRDEMAKMLSQSDLMASTLRQFPLGRSWSISGRDLAELGPETGRAGRDPRHPGARDRMTVQFAWSRIRSRFELASVMAHEMAHVRDGLERGFTLAEAAGALSLTQYLRLRWASELEAHRFQLTVLRQIAEAVPVLAPCLPPLISANPVLAALDRAELDAARAILADTYSLQLLLVAHATPSEAPLNDAEVAALGDYLKEPTIQAELAPWDTWVPVQ